MTTKNTPLKAEDLLAWQAGALSPDAAEVLAARLAADPAAQAMLADWAAQDAALATLYAPLGDEAVPARLKAVVDRAAQETRFARGGWWQLAAAIAVLGLGAGAGWFARGEMQPAPQMQSLQMAAIQAHETFVAEVRHPVEVLAADRAHLNTWMSKRMGRNMQPPDFATAGFTLLGGRIVPSGNGPAAFYMYEDPQGQRMTLYILPKGQTDDSAFQFASDGQTNTVFWSDDGLSCAVVADLPRETLTRIADAAYDQLL